MLYIIRQIIILITWLEPKLISIELLRKPFRNAYVNHHGKKSEKMCANLKQAKSLAEELNNEMGSQRIKIVATFDGKEEPLL